MVSAHKGSMFMLMFVILGLLPVLLLIFDRNRKQEYQLLTHCGDMFQP